MESALEVAELFCSVLLLLGVSFVVVGLLSSRVVVRLLDETLKKKERKINET